MLNKEILHYIYSHFMERRTGAVVTSGQFTLFFGGGGVVLPIQSDQRRFSALSKLTMEGNDFEISV